jgi:hypothetical protein
MVVWFVGLIQVITKAGYSPWWILLPVSLPVLYLITIATVFQGFGGIGTYGAFDVQGVVNEAAVLGLLTFLDIIANFAMFVVFAFSDWPVMQAARSRYPSAGGGGRGPRLPRTTAGLDSGGGQALHAPGASPLDLQGQPAGWHKTGPVGSGEQSYWDGTTWTARRRWSGGDWVDLPLDQPASVGPEGTGQPQT